ncbi:MAG: hypothetical protein Q9184_006372 [Pyrenodesmia sp. 2 TL-2023]
MADPFSAIGTAIKLAEFCLRFREVGSENRVFLNLIARVRKDLDEALRERHEKANLLKIIPSKRAWIDGVILDAQQELNNIGRLVEDARVDEQQGRPVSLKHRFDWVLSNHQKFVTEERALATCHQSLLAAMTVMHNLTVPTEATTSMLSLSPPAYQASIGQKFDQSRDDNVLRSPFQRRPGRALSDKASTVQMGSSHDFRVSSTLSLPAMMMDHSWSESLLRLSMDDHGRHPELLHMRSDETLGIPGQASREMISEPTSNFDSVVKLERQHTNQHRRSTSLSSPSGLSTNLGSTLDTLDCGDALRSSRPPGSAEHIRNRIDTLFETTTVAGPTEEPRHKAVLQERRRRARSRYARE